MEKEFWLTFIGTSASMITILYAITPKEKRKYIPLVAIPVSYIVTSLLI